MIRIGMICPSDITFCLFLPALKLAERSCPPMAVECMNSLAYGRHAGVDVSAI